MRESHTQTALFTELVGPQFSKRSMEVSECDPGHYKAGGYALLGLLGGLNWS